MLKELVYAGLGAATILKEKIESEANVEEGKNLFETLEHKGQEADEKFKTELKSIIKEIIQELNLATKDDIEQLKQELTKSDK